MKKTDLIMIRDSKPSDKNFIIATWLSGLYYGNILRNEEHKAQYSWFLAMREPIYSYHYRKLISSIIDNSAVKTIVACLRDDEDTILGSAVMNPESKVLHWLFTRADWRKIGIARMMMPEPEKIQFISHLTHMGWHINKRKTKWEFNPFLI